MLPGKILVAGQAQNPTLQVSIHAIHLLMCCAHPSEEGNQDPTQQNLGEAEKTTATPK